MKLIKDGLTNGITLATILLAAVSSAAFGQTPSAAPAASPADKRGLGIESAGTTNNSQAAQQSREAKPELVLQTGYNNFFGATRLVFSPDGRLLATATFRSSTIKLWDTATGLELRNFSSGRQSAMGMSPFIAFSGDSRLVAAAAGENSSDALGRSEWSRDRSTQGSRQRRYASGLQSRWSTAGFQQHG